MAFDAAVTARWRGPFRSTRFRIGAGLGLLLGALLFVLPLLGALPLALAEAGTAPGWQGLLADRQLPGALALSLRSALTSTGLALVLTVLIVTAWQGSVRWQRLAALLPALLAVPHAAFAIGLAWLIAPAGWLARALAVLTGWTEPPQWQSVNDPAGLALTAVLVFKELPFLLWNAAALLARPEVAATLQRERALARSLGYTPAAWWCRVGWMQWLPRLAWPLLAVLAYGLTVVDLALIVGPGSPPTLAVLAWQDLSDADPQRNAQGSSAALLLALLLALLVGLAWLGWHALLPAWRRLALSGRRGRVALAPKALRCAASGTGWLLLATYGGVLLSLLLLAVAGPWPFPDLLPPALSLQHGQQIMASSDTIAFTALLGLAVAAVALLLVLAWFEAAPPTWDRWLMPLLLLPLVLPQLLLLVGLYRQALELRLDGTVLGLAWVHLLMVLPYVFVALAPAWRSFDRRYEWSALSLGRARVTFWWRVKWPLLAAPMASALAIGFAVSVAQYLSTQFIGAGRHATLTTEAVTLASGGQRNLAAAFGLLQALLPVLAFGLAAWVARQRAALRG